VSKDDVLNKIERAFSDLVRSALHDTLAQCMDEAKGAQIDHGTALTIAHRECSLLSLGLLGSLMTGQEDGKKSNELLFMAQTRYQLDMDVMLKSFEAITGREIKREFTGAVHHA
jgi:hypothetical protein